MAAATLKPRPFGVIWRVSLKQTSNCPIGLRLQNGACKRTLLIRRTHATIPNPSRGSLYQPLSLRLLETRFLELLPSADTSSEIRCRLTKRSLLNPVPATESGDPAGFEVLSYTWGDSSDKKDILVNDYIVSVTANLEAFLRVRRQRDMPVMLSIDALCINQNDTHEKNFQIPLMLLIYTTAWRLTVWLGPEHEHEDSSLAMKTLAWLGSTSPYEKMPILELKAKQALDALLTRPWWTRIWIVQELAMGGVGSKLERIQVRCGNNTIGWGNIVVAAARMRAYHEDLRQPFPNTANILELDSLRESAPRFLRLSPESRSHGAFELICRYRHFSATDPRDKIYALAGLCARLGPGQIVPGYETPVEEIFTSFACDVISEGNQDALELLRQAGPSSRYSNLPSWAPDWSTPLGCEPLPLRRRVQRYFEVPWWAEPTEEQPPLWRDDGTIEPSHVSYRHFPFALQDKSRSLEEVAELRRASLRRLEIGADGYGVVRHINELPPNFLAHGVPEEIKGRIEELLQAGDTLLCVSDRLRATEEGASMSGIRLSSVKVGEILVERRVKRWLLRELQNDFKGAPYRAAGDSKLHAKVDTSAKTLEVKGIVCDTIDVCLEPFVEDVETDWRNTTRFMVQVGQSKALAMSHGAATARYSNVARRMEAFWNTLLVGQASAPDEYYSDDGTSIHGDGYKHWLPPIPSSWQTSPPPMVPITTGLVEMAEGAQAAERAQQALSRQPEFKQWAERIRVNAPIFPEFNPENWEPAKKEQYRQDAQAAAASWHQQPFDLYHRPFRFQNMIPDPYWEARQRGEDELLKQCTVEGGVTVTLHSDLSQADPATTVRDTNDNSDAETQESQTRYLLTLHQKLLRETPSMVPRCALPAGMEKYALGRCFFVTKSGRFGLGPKGARAGDRLVFVLGSGVPFLVRRESSAAGWGEDSGSGVWRLIGECYVEGVMGGEVMEELKKGGVKEEGMVLR